MFYNNLTASTDEEKANLFAKYFATSFINAEPSVVCDDLNISSLLDFGNLILSEDDILLGVNLLNNSKKNDIDGLSAYFIKSFVEPLCEPLRFMFNKSLCSGEFIARWKLALICPIYKSSNKCDISNYRPIAKLSSVSKLFEIVVNAKLSFAIKNVISPFQHGFFKGRSVVTNLLVFSNYCYKCLSSNYQLDVVYTDFEKAFDRVSHKILLKKLSALGIHSSFLDWIKSYLTNRVCHVILNGVRSKPFTATSGVPQGSILGPLLFALFINDIVDCFESSMCLLYADDLKIFRKVNNSHDNMLLQKDINNLLSWCSNNHLFLNVAKCFVMSYSRNNVIFPSLYFVNNLLLPTLDFTRDLGVVFDSRLTFINHLNYIIPKAFAAFNFIKRHSANFSDPYTLVSLFNSLVRSRLEFASVIWNPAYAVHSYRLERVQRVFTKFALRSFCSTVPEYNTRCLLLGLKSLESRRCFLSIIVVFDIVNSIIDCPTLLEVINFSVPSRIFRISSGFSVFNLPIVKSNFAANEPIFRALSKFNSLTRGIGCDLDLFSSRTCFKSKLQSLI